MSFEPISIICFTASYLVALALELCRLIVSNRLLRILATIFGGAGLFAHTVFLALRLPALTTGSGSLLFLAWILAAFYFFGSLRHSRQLWSVFVLPVLLALIAFATILEKMHGGTTLEQNYLAINGRDFWRLVHVLLFVLAATGICVGFVASIMYLVQAYRLKTKALPGQGLQMLSLERLEAMNRRAIALAFPFLTAGLLVGMARMLDDENRLQEWTDIRILGTIALWLLFAVLLYLRYGLHLRGRGLALLTIGAFALLLFTLVISHGPAAGGIP
jgi:ABC-type transport system involved in cytochrome c biogenesis permease subunit